MKRALSFATICASVFLLSSPVPALAQPIALVHFDITQMSFTATGAIKVQMAYSCPADSVFDADQGTILVVEQERTGAGTALTGFSDKLACDGRNDSVVVRVAGATGMGFDTTSGPIEVIFNASLVDADGVPLSAEDTNTVRPHAASDPAKVLADADIASISFTSKGSVRVHFSYRCPLRYEPIAGRTRLFVNQTDSMRDQITSHKRISALILCDGTRHEATGKVRESLRGEQFDPTAPVDAFVDVTISRPNGTTVLFANGETVLVEPLA